MKVRVLKEKWGNYSEGQEIDLPESTALACIKSGAVEDAAEATEQKDSPKKSKKK